jgi:hypothetical protein
MRTHDLRFETFADQRSFASADTRAIAALATWFVGCELLIWPAADVPIIDDWTYAWSVEHLLRTGHLEILPISAIYPVTQILFGALFALPSGFSFAALRFSTLVLAFAGACALYGTARELGSSPPRALFATLCVVCNPVSIVLAHSFMSDVPLMSLCSCAAYAYARGLNRRATSMVWLGGILSVAAVLVRQVAVVVPFAAAIVIWLSRDRPTRRALIPAAAGCGIALGAWLLATSIFGANAQQTERLGRLQFLALVGVGGYARLTLQMAFALVWMLLPLALASLPKRGFWWNTAAALIAIALLSASRASSPSSFAANLLDPDHATLSGYELGSARNLLAGEITQADLMRWVDVAVEALTFLGFGMLLIAALAALKRGAARALEPPARFFLVLAFLDLGVITALWLYSDRYYLVLLPVLVINALVIFRAAPISLPVGVAALVLQSWIGIAGTRDALHYNEMCSRAYSDLVRSGARPYDIDAGWSFNGWMLYAHPENLPPGADRERDVSAVTSRASRTYLLAKAPVQGYELLKRYRWRGAAWPSPNELMVLRKSDSPSPTVVRAAVVEPKAD